MLKTSTAPHICTHRTTSDIMFDVIIALMPAAMAAVLTGGVAALKVILTAVAGCVMFEYLACRFWLKSSNTATDYSAVVTGLLLAYNLPAAVPCWMILIGAFMAVIVAKICFGGIGCNIFNPALVGKVFLLLSFPSQIPVRTPPQLLNLTDIVPSYVAFFLKNTGSCVGEVSALVLSFGLGWLLWRRVISWHIPFYYLATVLLLSFVLYETTGNGRFLPSEYLLSDGLLLGAFFMATDYTTSPMTVKGQIIFAVGCGLLTVVIRASGAYSEGVPFAILIMNAFVPLIDKFAVGHYYGERR